MGMKAGFHARPRVIRGTRVKPLPLLPSGPGGVRSRPLHEARSLTISYASSFLERPVTIELLQLSNGHHAIVDIRKLETYCLNPEHPRGRKQGTRILSAGIRGL